MPRYFAGLDWASRTHAVCVVDEFGRVADRFDVAHDADGLQSAIRRLKRFAAAEPVTIAIERPSGLVVDALIDAGHPVFPLHPNAVKAMRPRYRSQGGKTDASDAYLLADALRTDGHRFRRPMPQSDSLQALRALVRGREDLVATRVELANQLRSLLESYWPGAAAIFADIDSPIGLGRRNTAELLERLRHAAQGCAQELQAESKGEVVQSLASVLERLVQQIAHLTARIEHEIAQLEDGRVIMSFPRAGRICAAQILAELGDVRERFPTNDVLADNSRHSSAWAAHIYAKARARGCDHPHAIRVLSRAWLRVLWRAWTDRKPYQPALHRGLQAING